MLAISKGGRGNWNLLEQVKSLVDERPIGAILVELIQGRGGIVIPPADSFGLCACADGERCVRFSMKFTPEWDEQGRVLRAGDRGYSGPDVPW